MFIFVTRFTCFATSVHFRGNTSFDNAGVGATKSHEVAKSDDEFDIYRKRMMLAYKFRPNPLVSSLKLFH